MTKKLLFYSLAIFLATTGLFAAYKWLKTDTSGEAIFAISSFVVSILLALKGYFIKSSSSNTEEILSVSIKRQNIRCYKEWVHYAIQIDIELFPRKKISIKNINLYYKEFYGSGEKIKQYSQLYLIKNVKEDLLKNELPTLKEKIFEFEQLPNMPFILNEFELLAFSISGYVPGERLSDGFEGLTLDNWSLEIEFNAHDVYKTPLVLNAHEQTLKIPIEYKNVGFIN